MSGGVMLWGWDYAALPAGQVWRKVRLDAAGHLQVDVITAGGTASHCYGWDLANWQPLRVESALLHNLRVRLYSGGTALAVDTIDASALYSGQALKTMAVGYALDLAELRPLRVQPLSTENLVTGFRGLITISALYGFDGTAWDRLRTYGVGILKVGRAEVGLLTVRKAAVGQVGAAGARKLYWMTMNPTAANSVVELTDDTDGSTAVVWDMTHGTNAAHHMNMDPPMEFTNGIYLKTFTNFTSIIFGYL